MITISFPCPVEKLRQLQELVKSVDARFAPMVSEPNGRTQYVVILFEKMESYNAFTTEWDRPQIRETKTPKWKQLLRRFFS